MVHTRAHADDGAALPRPGARDRARYVSAGVSTPRLVVASADGARVTDVDGRVFLDFAGGIGCQNTGHRFAPVVEAMHQQADDYLHQCFMVGMYEPYVDTCRLLAELSPCAGAQQKSLLVNSGAEANENAVKIARAATGRPAVIVFDNAFHGRTLLTMTMTSKVHPYKAGFGPFAPEVYRAPAPYPYRGVSTDDAIAGLEKLFKSEVDPETVACVLLEPVQGEGGFIPMPADFPARLAEVCARARDPLRRRRGAVGRRPDGEDVGDRALRRRRARPARLRQVDRRRAPAGRGHRPCRADGRRPTGRPRRHVRWQPAVVRGGDRRARSRARARVPRSRDTAWRDAARRLDALAAAHRRSARCAGSARCSRSSSPSGRPTGRKAIVDAAFERGLLFLACGLYGNVIRLLPALTIADEELEEGLTLLEESLAAVDG